MNPTQEYNYILINTSEKKRRYAPKLAADQLLCCGDRWEDIGNDGGGMFFDIDRLIYRRPVNVGEGYELVPANAEETPDMEFTRDGLRWHFNGPWCPNVRLCGFYFNSGAKIIAFRRKVAKPQPVGEWIATAVCLPEKGKPQMVVGHDTRTGCTQRTSWDGLKFKMQPAPDFWLPIPEPPKPAKSREQLAFEAWSFCERDPKAEWGWHAGIAWARQNP